jgi:hypothetical protein
MNRIGTALLVLPLISARTAGAQNPEPATRVERQVDVMVVHGPGQAGVPPLLASDGLDVDFMSMPLGVGGEPVTGAPYSAEAITDVVQTLSDGNRIVRQSKASVYRDTAGRTRREQGLAVLGSVVAGADSRTQVQIHDPQSGAMYLLDIDNRTAHRLPSPKILLSQRAAASGTPGALGAVSRLAPLPLPGGGAATTFALPPPAGEPQNALFIRRSLLTAPQQAQVEQLGKRIVEGVEAEGTRSTSTIPAGQIGNELPIAIVSERWFATELKVLMMSRQSDPRFGETTYRLTNVVRAEPPADLFQIPPDFKVVETPTAAPGTLWRMERK